MVRATGCRRYSSRLTTLVVTVFSSTTTSTFLASPAGGLASSRRCGPAVRTSLAGDVLPVSLLSTVTWHQGWQLITTVPWGTTGCGLSATSTGLTCPATTPTSALNGREPLGPRPHPGG